MDAIGSLALVTANVSAAIAAAAGTGKAVLNTIKAVGPYAVAQWDLASQAQARHNARLAVVETGKDFLKQELCNYAELSKELLSEYASATQRKKIQIQKDLEFIDQRTRQISVGILAIGYAQTIEDDTEQSQSKVQEEISLHWVDKFNELARTRNEDWRTELLARALASESASPGSVSPRALWFLGTLEEPIFRAFATILDLCTVFGGNLAIPNHQKFHERPLANSSSGRIDTIGRFLYLLTETGVLADGLSAKISFEKGVRVVTYGSEHFLIESPDTAWEVNGVLLSRLGESIASFCDRKPNPLGKEILDTFFKTFNKLKHTITPVACIGLNQYEKTGPPID